MLHEEIKSLVEEGKSSGSIQEIEQDLVENVFKVGDRKINSLMRHYSEVVSICNDCTIDDLRTIFKQFPHSAYPVIDALSSDILGLTHMKDILFLLFMDNSNFSITETIRPVHFIPENSSVYTVLEKFRSSKIHFAIIINEYGLIIGIVTINDILDAIIGDLDSTDGKAKIIATNENSWLVDARISFSDFCNYFDINRMYVENKGFTSLAGLIFDLLKHIPEIGEKISWREFEFEVVDMDEMRIDKIKVSRHLDS
jgi:putative hemolysin